MPKSYDYSLKYFEKDKNVTHRRCRCCKKMKKIENLERSNLCDVCCANFMGKKRCRTCNLRRPMVYFHKHPSTADGYKSDCKICIQDYKVENRERDREYLSKYAKKNRYKFAKYNSDRRVLQSNATIYPELSEEMFEIYKKCPKGHEVDHIIPLNHPLVCGLHVPWNLQYLTISENRKKSNKLIQDYNGNVNLNSIDSVKSCILKKEHTIQPTNWPITKKVINTETGEIWESVRKCAESNDMKTAYLKRKIDAGIHNKCTFSKKFKYIGNYQHSLSCRKKVINTETGEIWESITDCEKSMNFTHLYLSRRLRGKIKHNEKTVMFKYLEVESE